MDVRRMEARDLDSVLTWRNHPDVRRSMLTQHEIRPSEHRQWFERVSKDEKYALLIIEHCQAPIGCVIFSGVLQQATAEWSFYRAPESPSGTGTAICVAGLDFAFNELKVHKVAGQVLEFNIPSIRIHQNLGFVQEGFLREHSLIQNRRYGLLCFGMLSHEWSASNIREV